MQEIYLDNHTVSRPIKSLVDQMACIQRDFWASTSSPHRLGQQTYLPLITANRKIFDMLGATDNDGFYYSSCGAEAISQVFFSSYITHVKETGRNHFLATDLEEAPFLYSMKRLEKLGCSSKTLPVNFYGQLTKQVLEEGIRPRSGMLSISWANGLTGVIHPLDDIAEVCKNKKILLHVDASNMIGKSYFRFEDLSVDYLTFDGSLFHAPSGCAGTLVKWSLPFSSFSVGISSDPLASLVGLSEALEMASQNFDHMCTETARLRDRLENNLKQASDEIITPFTEAERVPNTSVICFSGVVNESLLYLLNSKGIYATIGGGKFQKLSHIMNLCGFTKDISNTSLSFSLSVDTTEEEVDRASDLIIESYKKLRSCSIFLKEEQGHES